MSSAILGFLFSAALLAGCAFAAAPAGFLFATFPFMFRHGSVLPLSAEEFERLQNAYDKADARPQ